MSPTTAEGTDITSAHMIDERNQGPSDLLDFYDGATVFITGATGFLGKLLLEKLLRTCNAKKIYILIRPKKGKDTSKRFEEIFDAAVSCFYIQCLTTRFCGLYKVFGLNCTVF